MEQNKDFRENCKKKRNRWTVLILMIFLLSALFIVQCELSKMKSEMRETPKTDEGEKQNIPEKRDSVISPDTLPTVQEETLDSTPKPKAEAKSKPRNVPKVNRDSIEQARKSLRDSIQRADSLRKADSIAYANRDSIPPEATIVPPTGRYYEPIQLKVKCDEIKCKTFYSIGDTAHIEELTTPVTYNKTGDVFYFAEDSAGNRSAWQSVHYDMASDNVCGKNAYPVPVNGKTVCVDAYEYPNQPEAVVKDMVSHDEAVKLCEQAGKRLCRFDEWSIACKGKDGFRYSYGTSYKPFKCNTNTKSARRAGRKEECRSWYGMYDMNGNLWEWTDTPAKEMPNRYLVAGGAWDTQNESKCTDTKYSFYPQNQYNFVGFRCCADANP